MKGGGGGTPQPCGLVLFWGAARELWSIDVRTHCCEVGSRQGSVYLNSTHYRLVVSNN
jgi:hypothetical protein